MGKFRDKIYCAPLAITFNDLIILPDLAFVEPKFVDTTTRVSLSNSINVPFASSPMESVTGPELAIALARQGGIGILHRNCSIEDQVEMAKQVKRAESFIIKNVISIHQDLTVREAIDIMIKNNIHGLPVVSNEVLIGIVTWRDVRFADEKLKVTDVMTRKSKLITAQENVTIEEAKEIMHTHRIEKLPITDGKGRLKGLITMKDIESRGKYPNAVRDREGRLLCGAAISPFDLERAKKLEPYVDVLVTDVAHFHNEEVIIATKKLVKEVSVDIVVGNIGTYEAAIDILTRINDVAGLRVGIGSGSICITGIITKAASPTVFATASASDALDEIGANIPIIADGGIKSPGDVVCALAVGASCVMMGNIFAGCRESPGRLIAIEGKYYKEYYGMGSHKAKMKRYSLDRYSTPSKDIEEGVEGWVPYRGTVEDVINEFISGLKAAMGYAGARNICELQSKARLALITPGGLKEISPHDIVMPGKSFLESVFK